jgi:hypothetical protein
VLIKRFQFEKCFGTRLSYRSSPHERMIKYRVAQYIDLHFSFQVSKESILKDLEQSQQLLDHLQTLTSLQF